MRYVGENENSAVCIGRNETFDELLAEGYDIYQYDGDKKTLIATPKDGFLIERPIVSGTGSAGSDIVRALRIIMGTDQNTEGQGLDISVKSTTKKTVSLKLDDQKVNDEKIDLVKEATDFRAYLDSILHKEENT